MKASRWCCQRIEQLYLRSLTMCSKPRGSIRMMATSSHSNLDVVQTDDCSGESRQDEKSSQRKTFLIVGLGNYGHPDTRHSVGMKTVDRLASRLDIRWEKQIKPYGGFICQTVLGVDDCKSKLVLFKPKALMNINGTSVAKTATLMSVAPENIYLIHDELDKTLGKFHIKEGGSAKGHNGVLSCMSCLKSNAMLRLRIGISRPSSKLLVVPYVLSKFSDSEQTTVNATIEEAIDALLKHIESRSVRTKSVSEVAASELGDAVTRKQRKKHNNFKSKISTEEVQGNHMELASQEINSTVPNTPLDNSKQLTTDENRKSITVKNLHFQTSEKQDALTDSTNKDSGMLHLQSDVEKNSVKSIKDRSTKETTAHDENIPER